MKHFKPHWPEQKKQFTQFTAGLTNKLFMVSLDGTDEKCLCRIYGKNTNLLIDRDQELVNLVSLHKSGLSPELVGRFNNGFCYGYLDGTPLDTSGMSDEIISPLTAKLLGTWHRTHVSGDMSPMLWETIERWLEYATPREEELHPRKESVHDRSKGDLSIADIRAEIAELRSYLKPLNSPVVFCHNDLLCNNILYNEKTESVGFIDYEYGNYSYRGFDIGNHFCEFAGMEDPVDYSLFPKEDFQKRWLRNYLSEYQPHREISTDDVEKLYREVNKFGLAAHIYWGVWALVQAKFSDIDFDYAAYAQIRFLEYLKRKDEFLAL
ncbi:hypothetical protein SARC_03402 [Sphaeroforma arctica JP610]|uniref:ethanolamine kinase n=1 Tax=Sphaeroforma arctica JP610 TaxID=667725 RepID=A0A0L0G693_9EUKA|nr:hypothetical protein SARC_03402 [Sphaeroforma arctica JP610]KNC84386.1 hypothetical protein SARC_03402 [Sphaeroforma arctica JP610]|eukprot:XP_014158288.1 hypothetical protein SARC_03402 [Sphaeroforma arctica JP610]